MTIDNVIVHLQKINIYANRISSVVVQNHLQQCGLIRIFKGLKASTVCTVI